MLLLPSPSVLHDLSRQTCQRTYTSASLVIVMAIGDLGLLHYDWERRKDITVTSDLLGRCAILK